MGTVLEGGWGGMAFLDSLSCGPAASPELLASRAAYDATLARSRVKGHPPPQIARRRAQRTAPA